jgi:tripartite-type tricarboxylate transporter receptor subunit TctC
VVASPGTPDTVVQRINVDIAQALNQADVRTKFLDQGAEPVGQDPAATARFIRDEERRWREVIKSANVILE